MLDNDDDGHISLIGLVLRCKVSYTKLVHIFINFRCKKGAKKKPKGLINI